MQRIAQPSGKSVAPFRPVERNDRNSVALFDQDERVGHQKASRLVK
jgi:hypothetical protein